MRFLATPGRGPLMVHRGLVLCHFWLRSAGLWGVARSSSGPLLAGIRRWWWWMAPRYSWLRGLGVIPRHSWQGLAGCGGG